MRSWTWSLPRGAGRHPRADGSLGRRHDAHRRGATALDGGRDRTAVDGLPAQAPDVLEHEVDEADAVLAHVAPQAEAREHELVRLAAVVVRHRRSALHRE